MTNVEVNKEPEVPLSFTIVRRIILGIILFTPFIIGSVLGNVYPAGVFLQTLNQPSFIPPGYVFAVVWSVLNLLIGVCSVLAITSLKNSNNGSYIDFFTCVLCPQVIFIHFQIVLDSMWIVMFNKYQLIFASALLLTCAIFPTALLTLYWFLKEKHYVRAICWVPYPMWLVVAQALNWETYRLN